jgi:hypothetical protein
MMPMVFGSFEIWAWGDGAAESAPIELAVLLLVVPLALYWVTERRAK